MSEFRFHLQKYKAGTKITCPQCGHKRCFTRYIDAEGNVQFPDHVGRCDRENNCGYHYTPKQFFSDNPSMDTRIERSMVAHAVQPIPKSVSYIDESIVNRTLSKYDINTLYQWLIRNIDKQKVDALMKMYRVGTARKWGGSAVFWQTDINGNVRDGKIMLYDTSGHRVKQPFDHITWVAAEMKWPDFNRRQCLFGEHLLSLYPSKRVMVVESEKTAIVGSAFYPSCIWLATGGKHGSFNRDAMSALRGRDVTLIPDLNAEDEWSKKADECLKGVARSYAISDAISKRANEEQKKAALDIADFLLMEETTETVLAYMIQRNPTIQDIIEAFDMRLITE